MTAIELLVVLAALVLVGCVGLLMMPTLCDSGNRPVVSRVKADQRSLAVAIETYFVDHNSYPEMKRLAPTAKDQVMLRKAKGNRLMTIETGRGERLCGLTTPLSYIPSMFPDPFTGKIEGMPGRGTESFNPYAYYLAPRSEGWIVFSPGPDGDYDITDPAAVYQPMEQIPSAALIDLTYDPTNGSGSNGDIYRVKQ